MLSPDQIGKWFVGLVEEIGRIPEYAGQLGLIASFFGGVGAQALEQVAALNEHVRRLLQR